MKKRVFSMVVMVALLFTMWSGVAFADNDIVTVILDGKELEFDVPAQTINGRTMVPIRTIFETMGAKVEWDEATSSAICTKDSTVVKMTIDSKEMYINNQVKEMDVAPVVINGRTLAPARYVAEAFEANVQWSEKNKNVVICSKDVYAYVDYPDIPDLGKCYNIPVISEESQDGNKFFTYVYSDMTNEEYYSYLYDNSALVLGNYIEESMGYTDGVLMISYTKPGEEIPSYLIGVSYDVSGAMVFVVVIPDESVIEKRVTLYSLDGRTIDVSESEVSAYLNVGWYETLEETQQIMYAPDGRTTKVFKAEVSAYKNVGWYETEYEAQAVNNKSNDFSYTDDSGADGYYYRTPSGKRYHLDPNCGGKNSYRTTNISGLSPCKKCAS